MEEKLNRKRKDRKYFEQLEVSFFIIIYGLKSSTIITHPVARTYINLTEETLSLRKA